MTLDEAQRIAYVIRSLDVQDAARAAEMLSDEFPFVWTVETAGPHIRMI